MEIQCEGHVSITLPEREDYSQARRVTTGTCPDHGPFRIVERYDLEKGQWEVVSRFIVQELNTPSTHPAPSVPVDPPSN